MESSKRCQVRGCEWPVVLCPELCAPHWWKLPKTQRDAITRAQTRGQKDGNHPSQLYQVLINTSLATLDADQGNLAKYVREDFDKDARHSALTHCATCQGARVHHTIIRGPDTLMVCDECQSMIPSILPGSQRFTGMEPSQ